MCFSAEVSLAMGAALLPAGVYCTRQAWMKDPSYLALAVIPIVFGIQQISEGVVWIGLHSNDHTLARTASLVFLAFALVFWPFWIPFSASLIENRRTIRRAFQVTAGTGLCCGLLLYIPLLIHSNDWLLTSVHFHSIAYDFSTLPLFSRIPSFVWQISYLISVSAPLLIAGKGARMKLFGVLIGASAVVSQLAFWYAFYSVWCLFAAGLSVCLIYIFHNLSDSPTYGTISA